MYLKQILYFTDVSPVKLRYFGVYFNLNTLFNESDMENTVYRMETLQKQITRTYLTVFFFNHSLFHIKIVLSTMAGCY